MDKALKGVRILDLSRVLAGPYATMMLADMGAEVIKVEIPNFGDDSRRFPSFLEDESGYFMNMNRNKKGITLNLKSSEGKEIFKELVKKSDILVENFRPGTMEKLGLGYEALKEINPALVYGCVSGFGHFGPYKDRPGYDIIGQAMSGLMSVTGWPGGAPTRTGGPMSDTMAGLSVTIGILGALHYSKATGIGQKVDVSLVDSLVASLQIINQIYLIEGRLPERIGNRYESSYPYDTFPTNNGKYVVIACANDKFFVLLAKLMGKEELLEDERFNVNRNRVINHEQVSKIVSEWTSQYSEQEVLDMLMSKGIPCSPIYSIEDVSKDEHIVGAREMFVEVEYPKVGKIKVTNSHIKMSETKTGFRMPAPDLGEHNEEIYSSLLGMDQEKIKNLVEKNII